MKNLENDKHIKGINRLDNENKGKNYAISDVHGMYGSYMEAISKLKPQDTLYIIGDVIDRGKNGIKIILDIMERQQEFKKNPRNNPNIIFLCGNHELSFCNNLGFFYEIINENHKKEEVDDNKIAQMLCRYLELNETVKACKKNVKEISKKFAEGKGPQIGTRFRLALAKNTLEGYCKEEEQILKQYIRPFGLEGYDHAFFKKWLFYNKAKSTFLEFMQLDKKQKVKIVDFIMKSYVSRAEKIAGKNYFLVHAMPPDNPEMMKKMKERNYTVEELFSEEETLKFVLESRYKNSFNIAKEQGFITICGHTPKDNRIHIHTVQEEDENWKKKDDIEYVMIDAGCGHTNDEGNDLKYALAFYCLDDGKVEYIEEREEYKEVYNVK